MENQPETPKNAGPWSRFFARYIDFACEFTILFYLLWLANVLITWNLSEEGGELFNAFFTPLLYLLLPSLIMLLDGGIYRLLGYTPGKMIYALSVVDAETGQPLKASRYLRRNFMVLVFGFAMGWVQMISLLALCIQCSNLQRRGSTGYDKSLRTRVICHHSAPWRMLGGILIYIMILVIFFSGLYFLAGALGVSFLDMLRGR